MFDSVVTDRGDRAEEAVALVVGPGAEEHGTAVAGHAVPDLERPQAVDRDRLAGGITNDAEVAAVRPVVRVDVSVAEVANEQRAAELTEPRRCDGHAPRRIERATGDEPPVQPAVGPV